MKTITLRGGAAFSRSVLAPARFDRSAPSHGRWVHFLGNGFRHDPELLTAMDGVTPLVAMDGTTPLMEM